MEKICTICKEKKDNSLFVPYYEKRKEGLTRNVCRKCASGKNISRIKSNPERLRKTRAYMRDYYKKYNDIGKVKAYRSFDKSKGFLDSITLLQFRKLLEEQNTCIYCGEKDKYKLGLDRLHNNKGHILDNVTICCEKCNHILGDLPLSAKKILAKGLRECKDLDLLKNWEIKTKRYKNEGKSKL